ncbi:MAG: hypothetical protein LBD20_05970 [Spirochaetaceae bacterium]|nr:hypothetical protein [Spirochaetaceae bacterium]
MNATAIRQELKGYIDALPEASLEAVRPLLRSYSEGEAGGEPIVYETDLTAEERELIAEGMKGYEEHPENFFNWDDVKREAGLT